MYKVRPRIPLTQNTKEKDPNIAASAVTESLGRAEPMTDCAKPPFVVSRCACA